MVIWKKGINGKRFYQTSKKERKNIYIYITADTVQISVEAFNEAMQREIAMVSVVKRLCIAYLSTLMDSGGCRNFLQH